MTAQRVSVFDCPSCGAPLPEAADGLHTKCRFCGTAATVESGGAAELRARASRAEAEKLFATLGQPPSWSQRVAVVLADWRVWVFGLPFAFALFVRLARLPTELLESLWERHYGERLMHVASPMVGWLLSVGVVAGIVILFLVWSLLGKRVDARRELQATLAAKPPKTPGGPASCRQCGAELTVAAGALGVRCEYCGADNLVLLPEKWVARARRKDAKLRLTIERARATAAFGRRRVLVAALWRLPLVALCLYLLGPSLLARRRWAGFADFHLVPSENVGAFRVIIHHAGGDPTQEVHTLGHCSDTRARETMRRDSRLALDANQWCDARGCELAAMFALERGQSLRLEWLTPAPVTARVALAPRDYTGGAGVLWDGFGDVVFEGPLSDGTPALEARATLKGWYKLALHGPATAAVEPCIAP